MSAAVHLKFGLSVLLATFLATFQTTDFHWTTIGLLFASVGRHDFQKIWQPLHKLQDNKQTKAGSTHSQKAVGTVD